MRVWIRRRDADMPTACRPQVADTCGERREWVERLAELRQCQRLNVVLQIGRLTTGVGARETTELGGRHRHRPAPPQRILERDSGLVPERLRSLVERAHARNLECTADLQVVLQVLADTTKLVANLDAGSLEHTSRSYP